MANETKPTLRQLDDALSLLTDDEQNEVLRGCYESSENGQQLVAEEWQLRDVKANWPELVADVLAAMYPDALEAAR